MVAQNIGNRFERPGCPGGLGEKNLKLTCVIDLMVNIKCSIRTLRTYSSHALFSLVLPIVSREKISALGLWTSHTSLTTLSTVKP